MASAVVALLPRWTDAPNQDRLEAGIPLNRAFPVIEPTHGFFAPRHGALKRGVERSANYQSLGDRNARELLPIAGVDSCAARAAVISGESGKRN
jgi:hypothetical protein